jgi:hypothetical protein
MKGVGKGTLGRLLADICGRHGLPIASPQLLTGRFNLHLRDCILLFADEAFWAGDKAGEGTLKQLITEPRIMYEGKGSNAETGRNLVHVVMASNLDWVVPASIADERRFAVFDVDPKFKGDQEFWEAVNTELDNGGRAAFLHDMLARDISRFHPRNNLPVTEALAEQAMHSMDPIEEWFFGLIVGEQLPARVDDVNWHEREVGVWCSAFYEDYIQGLGHKARFSDNPTAFGLRLKKLCGGRFARKQKKVPEGSFLKAGMDGRAWFYVLPSLSDLKKKYAHILKAIN